MVIELAVTLAFIGLDVLTGLCKAFSTTGYSSENMRKGLWHKLSEILGYCFGVCCDIALPKLGIIVPIGLGRMVTVYIVFMEIGSIIENLGIMSPTLGQYLSKVFAKVKEATPEEYEVVQEEKDDGSTTE